MMNSFNAHLAVLAREAMGLSQKELSQVIGIEQGSLSKIENGILEPSSDIVGRLSKALGFPESYFNQIDRPSPVQGHYRRKMSSSVKNQKSAIARFTLAERHFSKLCEAIDLDPPAIFKWDVNKDGSPELCSKFFREKYNVRGKIPNLTAMLEEIGFIIIELDLGDIDGFGTMSSTGYPLMFVNSKSPGDRDNFNKAHELFHFLAHWGQKVDGSRNPEQEANAFASELLIPSDLIHPHLEDRLTLEKLMDLKSYWGVSMQAILYKAKQIGAISDNQSDYLWRQMSARGYRKKEPITIERNRPQLMKQLYEIYKSEFEYTRLEFEEALKFKQSTFEEWYLNKPSLKISHLVPDLRFKS